MNDHSSLHTEPPAHDGSDVRPRGRRATRTEELRGRLMAAAGALVAERQVAAITARDIARAAGVSDGALYNHFADKHELILAALLARFGRLVAIFERDVATVRDSDPPLPLEEGLDQLTAAAFRLQSASLPMLAHVLSEPVLFHRYLAAIHQPPFGGQVFMNPFEGYLAAELAEGRTAEIVPAAAADMLLGAVLLLALLDTGMPRPAADREQRLHDLVRTLVSGLAPRPQAVRPIVRRGDPP